MDDNALVVMVYTSFLVLFTIISHIWLTFKNLLNLNSTSSGNEPLPGLPKPGKHKQALDQIFTFVKCQQFIPSKPDFYLYHENGNDCINNRPESYMHD